MAVPAADARWNLAFPDAEAAEFLGHVQQLGQMLRPRGQRMVGGDVAQGPEPVLGNAGDAGLHPQCIAGGSTQRDFGVVDTVAAAQGREQ